MDSKSAGTPEFALLQESSLAASRRLRFFRVAFGAADRSTLVSHSQIRTLLTDGTSGGKLRLAATPEADLSRAEVQLACLSVLFAEKAMPYGGQVHCQHDGVQWRIEVISDRAPPRDSPLPALAIDQDSDWSAGGIHVPLLVTKAAALGRHPQAARRDDGLSLTV